MIKFFKSAKETLVVMATEPHILQGGLEATKLLCPLLESGKIELRFPCQNLVINNESTATDYWWWFCSMVAELWYKDILSQYHVDTFLLGYKNGEWPY
jgi:hypothetical protein